jgi:lysozyme family protein
MSAFDDAFEALLGNEGGYVDNPNDPGGATMWGVTERVARAHGYAGDMRELPQDFARQIAKTEYWDPYQCDQFDPRIGFQVFDAAYNGGEPARWLQQAAGVTADGVIGAQTIGAVRNSDPLKIIMRFDASRLEYMASLSNWPPFGRGWARRIAENLIRGAA